jgi:hypothetical protein
MRTLVLVVSALIALSSCMQQNTASDAEKTPQSVTTQSQTATTETPSPVEPTPVVDAETSVKHAQSLKQLNQLIQKMGAKPKTYTVSSTKISRIKGDKGSILEVDPKALENVDGTPVTGNIVVEFAEYTSAKDLLFAGAPTVSDGKLLVSAGSYYVSATNNGKTMRIKNGKDLKLSVADIQDKEMDIYYGEKDANGLVNWKWDSDIFKEGGTGISNPVSIGTEALADAKPKVTDAQFNCFNIIYDGKNYSVITVGSTVKIKRAENNTQIQYIRNTTFPATTLCVRGFSEKYFRTYKADTTRKGSFVEYLVTDGQSKDATDIDYIKALKSTSIKLPVNSIITRVVPERLLSDTLLTIKAAAIKKQEGEAKKRIWKDPSSGDWSGFNIGDLPSSAPPPKDMLIDSVKRVAASDLMGKMRGKYTILRVQRLGFTNCDRPMPPIIKYKPLLAMFNADEFDYVSGIFVFKNQLSCVYANYFQNGMVGFKEIPENSDGVLVTFCSINNRLYAQVQNLNSKKEKVSLSLKPMDNKAFKDLLEASIK